MVRNDEGEPPFPSDAQGQPSQQKAQEEPWAPPHSCVCIGRGNLGLSLGEIGGQVTWRMHGLQSYPRGSL